MSSRCWVVGSAVLDTVYSVDRLPQPGESVIANKVEQFLGGKGFNQCISAARSGAQTSVFLCLGQDDSVSRKFWDLLLEEHVDSSNVIFTHQSQTGTAAISIGPDGRNQITVHPGANMHLPDSLISSAPIKPDDFILCQFEVTDEVIIAASQRGHFILNPAPYRDFPSEIIKNCFAITPNETEAAALTGITPDSESNLHQCADKLLTMGVQNVIITLGERGAFLKNTTTSLHSPAPKVKAIDTTAAGDVFNGALIAMLSLGETFEQSISYAIAAATLSVTKPGAVPSIPIKEEIDKFLSGRNP